MPKTADRPAFWSVVAAFAVSDSRILWRMRTPLAFMFAVPAVLAVTLGPAVSGAGAGGSAVPGRSMVGIAVMFSFMTVNYTGLALFREYTNHTWVRQAVNRPARTAFLLGKMLPVAAAGLIQLGIFAAVAFVAYGLPLHGSPAQLLVVAVALVAAGCALGAVLFVVTRTAPVFQSIAYVLLLTTGSVGGAIVPSDQLPAVSRAMGFLTPQHWAMRALDETTSGAGSWGPTVQAVAVIGALALVLAVVAVVGVGYNLEKSAFT
ncbi:ABC transporter permease [Micromonospora sp. WMMD1120]|uniref:ABC transporter permease n=1 Tax=Micromonospora sp. WMMD1120 TaxID=3016106 RepID=UPI0024170AAE|nr:ABC transporter permease [Micromonospora sp. WMMD1120]MDG4807567.1 ABC transporter permease [Micromonospora sp. WMMD1120]